MKLTKVEGMKLASVVDRAYMAAYRDGATHAADIADQYNSSTTHDHRIGDCVLAKMNLRRARPRRNGRKLPSAADVERRVDEAMIRGIALALSDDTDRTRVQRVCRGAGLTVADFTRAEVPDSILGNLRRALSRVDR